MEVIICNTFYLFNIFRRSSVSIDSGCGVSIASATNAMDGGGLSPDRCGMVEIRSVKIFENE